MNGKMEKGTKSHFLSRLFFFPECMWVLAKLCVCVVTSVGTKRERREDWKGGWCKLISASSLPLPGGQKFISHIYWIESRVWEDTKAHMPKTDTLTDFILSLKEWKKMRSEKTKFWKRVSSFCSCKADLYDFLFTFFEFKGELPHRYEPDKREAETSPNPPTHTGSVWKVNTEVPY